MIQPNVSVFGQKDYQQQLIIRHMSSDLNLPIKIITGKTIRENDGLAMSSRNQYLSKDERRIAPVLFKTLTRISEKIESGNKNYRELEENSKKLLNITGFSVDYLSIRDFQDLQNPSINCKKFIILTAVKLGKTRLIDNIIVKI
tara:strand:- start:1175 stop:1606 length:432 start_codon:yes stop_codon:yes gene_type:complete